MDIQKALTEKQKYTLGIDNDIARALDPTAVEEIDKRLLKVDTLRVIARQAEELEYQASEH